jgi:radical SAM protein
LSTAEAKRLIDQLAEFGAPSPQIVMTGGDPLKRPDLYELISHARARGLGVSITPSGTYALTEPVVRQLREAGIGTIAVSLDGSNAQRHDDIRGVPGSFEWTVQAARHVRAEGLPLQFNTLVCAETLKDLPAMAPLVQSLGAMRWSLFFLISVGRGQALREVTPEEGERLMNWLLDLAPQVPFDIKTTEAPHFRRVALQRRVAAKRANASAAVPPSVQRGFGIRDGHGIMFISHVGEIFPSGFLPLAAGNARRADPVSIYRDHPLFQSLRDADQFLGKCGVCEFRHVCGGSRARAFAATGNPLDSDPFCPYIPAQCASAE